jgi:hypothetical protein
MRWETYSPDDFEMVRSQVPSVRVGEFMVDFIAMDEVLQSGKIVRAMGGGTIWNPLDGHWYKYKLRYPDPKWGTADGDERHPTSYGDDPPWLQPLTQELIGLDESYPTEAEILGARTAVIDRHIAAAATPRS